MARYKVYMMMMMMMMMISGGSTLEQGVQLHPRFWLCTPVWRDAMQQKVVITNNITLGIVERTRIRNLLAL